LFNADFLTRFAHDISVADLEHDYDQAGIATPVSGDEIARLSCATV